MVKLNTSGKFMHLEDDDKVCLLCTRSAKNKTMTHRNEGLPNNFQFHSECIKDKIQRDGDPIDALRLMNIAYINNLWNQILEASNGDMLECFTRYIRAMGPRRQYSGFVDSEFGEEGENQYIITEEMESKWGSGLPIEEYKTFESAYKSLTDLKAPTTQLEKDRYIAAVILQRRVKNAYLDDSINGSNIKNIQDAYENALKAIGLDTQAINNQNTEKFLGERIRDYEENRPLPTIAKEFLDIDNIKVVFTRWFLYPLLRNFDKVDDKMIAEMNEFSRDYIPGYNDSEDDADDY